MTCQARVTTGRRHFCGPFHRDLVTGYRLARYAQEQRAEAVSMGYETELAEYYRDVETSLTFKDWLIWSRQEPAAA